MKPHEKIKENFKKFYKDNQEQSFVKLKEFFEHQKEIFYQEKINELLKDGLNHDQAVTKTRQSWVSVIGRNLEIVIETLIKDFCDKNDLKITNDKVLKRKNLKGELDEVKRKILIDFGANLVLPDGDIILYKTKPEIKILAILSIKNSFRERYTETPYWKIKLANQNITKHIKIFMITPDNDDEISFQQKNTKPRIVLEHELDGVYLAKDNFDNSKKIKSINNLIDDLRTLL